MSDPVRVDEAIDAALDAQQIGHLDFDVPCSFRYQRALIVGTVSIPLGETDPCPRTAVSTMACTVCGQAGFVCAEHRTEVASAAMTQCGWCEVKAPGSILFRFAPLAGA